jgi:hypothetical protein
MAPRGSDASAGPPELRLYSDEAGERVEPYAPPPVPSSAPPPRAGPSDFTRMLTPVEAPNSAPPPPAVRPNAKPEPAGGGRKPSMLPLLIVVMFAFVAAATLILYIVLKK